MAKCSGYDKKMPCFHVLSTGTTADKFLDKNYTEPLFKLQLGMKDIRLITETATESNTPMRFARVLQDRFSAAAAHGLSLYDWTGIAAEVEAEAGL